MTTRSEVGSLGTQNHRGPSSTEGYGFTRERQVQSSAPVEPYSSELEDTTHTSRVNNGVMAPNPFRHWSYVGRHDAIVAPSYLFRVQVGGEADFRATRARV